MTDIALPFDRTVPLAIYVASHRQELVYPFKRFDISHSFRGERPQAGRFRGFIQADIDIVDENLSFLSEIECLSALVVALERLQIPRFTVYLNHLSIPKTLLHSMGITEDLMPEALRIVDKMDKIGQEKVCQELKILLPTIDLSPIDTLSFKGTFENFMQIAPESLTKMPGFLALQNTLSFLKQGQISTDLFGFCPGMVRGLDYYTGIIFETFLQDYPNLGSIASGGRYNKLVDSIVNQETKLEGFGISIGLTRLFDILKKENLLPASSPSVTQVLVAYREPSLEKEALLAAGLLRKQGFYVDLYSGKGNIGKQLSYASKKEISYVFMLMGESFVIKNLQTGSQTPDISSLDLAINMLLEKQI
jgi:histidyl-tRNA synthetase